MSKRLFPSLLLLILSLAALNAAVITPGQLIFKAKSPLQLKSDRTGLIAFDSYLNSLGASNLRQIKGMHAPLYYLADIASEPDWQALREGDLHFQGIEYVQPNYCSTLHITPNDPLYTQQFHTVVSNPQAWNYTTGSSQIVVGIVDSGCLIDHPDLQENIWVNPGEIAGDGIDNDNNGYIDDIYGWDFTDAPEFSDTAIGDYLDQDNDVEDENFHGTHVAGIIGAVGNNGIGVTGVAWNVKLMPVRAGFRTTAGQGTLQDDDAAAAIIYAADNGCHVVNMSWGDPNYSPIIGDACEYAHSRGVTLVASAGNDPGPYLSYPAKLSTVISVGAINRNRNIAGFSSYGIDMDLVAPGELVLSTYKNDIGEQYFEQSGTSMSSPYVAGAAALLLSLHPGLSPDDVRARLLTATDDLGATGIDQYYGHGLLNTKKLLENTDPPLIYIDQPVEQQGITQSTDITGTAMGGDFFRYSLMYTGVDTPTILDWYDTDTHQNYPSFHTAQIQNDVLGHFDIPEGFPEGDYTLRIQYENTAGGKFNYYRTITYDRSPPVLRTETMQAMERYEGQNLRYYVSAVFDEPVRSELLIIDALGNTHHSYGTQMDSLHVWAIPPTLPQGEIDIQISGVNKCGLSYTSELFDGFMDIEYKLITNYGYNWQELGMARVPLNHMHDYNQDGHPEYLAMDLPTTGYGGVYAYQPGPTGHAVTHNFNDTFWLLGAGDTNNLGQEILQLKSDTAVLLESQLTTQYPNLAIWEDTSITGGVMVDYSNDGTSDLLLVKNLPAERVIQAYKRTGTTFTDKNTLHNTSETNVRNTFVPTIIVKNFDNDNYLDILTADTDGDVMIYEIRNDNMDNLVWSHRMPIGNTYNLTSGDFDGNGRPDFFIGGYYRDSLDPSLNFWYFEGFRNIANNNYNSMGSIMFNGVTSQNAIQAMDLDSDGQTEIIMALSPNLYILKYQNNKFVPQFYGNSYRTYAILAYKDSDNKPYFVTNYSTDADSVVAVEWTSTEPYTGPPTPVNFLVRAQDHESVQLSWLSNAADYYRIYRRDEEGEVTLLDLIGGTSHLDTGLEEGKTYQYAITAYNSSFTPPESTPTNWLSVVPYHVPQLLSVNMVAANALRLIFDQPMAGTIINPTLYFVSHGMQRPTSVNSIEQQCGVQLHFDKAFPPISEDFLLTLSGITSKGGISLQENIHNFIYQEDTEPPRIEDVVIAPDKMSLDLVFSESLATFNPNPELLQNYNLICPSNDPDNAIVTLEHLDNVVRVGFNHGMKHSSAAYTISVSGVRDLAGNVISPQHNLARFYLSDIRNLDNITVFPNPVYAENQQWCSFINFPDGKNGRIKIFDSGGNLVFASSIGPFDSNINNIAWHWELKNNKGKKVSSGVYFYVIEMDGNIARGKIAVVN